MQLKWRLMGTLNVATLNTDTHFNHKNMYSKMLNFLDIYISAIIQNQFAPGTQLAGKVPTTLANIP